jgi:hypothetical protein
MRGGWDCFRRQTDGGREMQEFSISTEVCVYFEAHVVNKKEDMGRNGWAELQIFKCHYFVREGCNWAVPEKVNRFGEALELNRLSMHHVQNKERFLKSLFSNWRNVQVKGRRYCENV